VYSSWNWQSVTDIQGHAAQMHRLKRTESIQAQQRNKANVQFNLASALMTGDSEIAIMFFWVTLQGIIAQVHMD
jgi:hypothetical protein